MKYKIIFIFLLILGCAQNISKSSKVPFNSKGFAYIYKEEDYNNKIIKSSFDNNLPLVAHNKLRQGTFLKIINPVTNDSITLKNSKKIKYPEFYKLLITEPVANKLNLDFNQPFIELIEVKKNKSFIAKKSKIYQEEKKVSTNAPVEQVKIKDLSNDIKTKKKQANKIFIVIAEFYSNSSAKSLKNRIINEVEGFNQKKLFIKSNKTNEFILLSGPYNSINLVKNDYIQLKNFGFEELDLSIND